MMDHWLRFAGFLLLLAAGLPAMAVGDDDAASELSSLSRMIDDVHDAGLDPGVRRLVIAQGETHPFSDSIVLVLAMDSAASGDLASFCEFLAGVDPEILPPPRLAFESVRCLVHAEEFEDAAELFDTLVADQAPLDMSAWRALHSLVRDEGESSRQAIEEAITAWKAAAEGATNVRSRNEASRRVNDLMAYRATQRPDSGPRLSSKLLPAPWDLDWEVAAMERARAVPGPVRATTLAALFPAPVLGPASDRSALASASPQAAEARARRAKARAWADRNEPGANFMLVNGAAMFGAASTAFLISGGSGFGSYDAPVGPIALGFMGAGLIQVLLGALTKARIKEKRRDDGVRAHITFEPRTVGFVLQF